MDVDELKSFIQERFLEYDPGADIDEGGALDADVIQPLVDYLGSSPYDTSAYEFVLDRLQQFNPNDLVDQGDALVDLAVKPLSFILDPIVFELNRLKNNQSFRYPELLTREAAQSLGANLFVSMKEGTYTTGGVRLYFSSPVGMSVNQTNVLETVNGEMFVPHFVQAISQAEMTLNRQGSFYYWDIVVKSLEPGAFDVGPGEIISIEGLDAVVRVTNLDAMEVGEAQETAEEFVSRASEALTERSLVTARGASARLRELFPEIRSLEVSGYNDIEMARDAVSYESSGDRAKTHSTHAIQFPRSLPLGTSDRISIEADDGGTGSVGPYTLELAGVWNTVGDLVGEINKQWLAAGGKGSIASSWGEDKLLIHSWSGIPNANQTASESWVKLITPAHARSAWTLLGFVAAQLDTPYHGDSGILISSMPGGILRPNTPDGNFIPEERRFHVGGCTDVFIRPSESSKAEAPMVDMEDIKPMWFGTKLQSNPVSGVSDRVRDKASILAGARPGRPDWSKALNISQPDLKYSDDDIYDSDFINGGHVEPGDVLVIRNDTELGGAYMIAATQNEDDTLDSADLRLNRTLPVPKSDLTYHVSSGIRMDLVTSKRRVKITSIQGTKLQAFGGSDTVAWQTPLFSGIDTNNFHRHGVQSNDILEVYYQSNGDASENKGSYLIEEVTGNTLKLDRKMLATELLTFRVYEEGSDAVELPLVRINKVNLLDASGAPTGVAVPYALPVLIQSQGVSGARVRMEGNDGIIDGSSLQNSYELTIPSNILKNFTVRGVQAGDVVKLTHSTALGTKALYRTVYSVEAYSVRFTEALPVQTVSPFTHEEDVRYSIGPPARGSVRLYFKDPVSFEVRQEPMAPYFFYRWRAGAPSPSFRIGSRDDTGALAFEYQPRAKGILGGKRIYPAKATGEDSEQWNVDLELAPTFARDMSYSFPATPDTYETLLFSELKLRELGILPSTVVGSESYLGDILLVYPERLLGQGNITTYTSATAAKIDATVRQAHSFCAMIPEGNRGSLVVPFDFFNLTSGGFTGDALSVEGRWGTLKDALVIFGAQPDGAATPNSGTYRVSSVPAGGHTLEFRHTGLTPPTPLAPTDPLVNECGRASYDQWVLTLNSGAFVVGEEVSFLTGGFSLDVLTAKVGYWDADTKKVYIYGLSRPSTTTAVTGATLSAASGSATILSADPLVYAVPQDGTTKFKFSGDAVAPGYIEGKTNGPWQIGHFIALFGNADAPVTQDHADELLDCMGTWKIISVAADGKEVTVENVGDSSKQFAAPSVTPLGMKWVISEGPRPVEMFNVYDHHLQEFSISSITYEEGGAVQDGKMVIRTFPGMFGNYSKGLAFSGVKCPYQISRPGITRISSTEMQLQEQDNLYYMDLEVASLGPDTEFNRALDDELEIVSAPDPKRGAYRGKYKEYVGEGYVTEVKDPTLTYSTHEQVSLAMYPRILRPGDPDTENSKIAIDGTSLGVAYDRSELIENIDLLLASDTERVTTASMLVRHFTPAYVLLDLAYNGSVQTSTLVALIKEFVNGLTGSERLEVSDIEAIIHKQGVDFIDQEFSLVALFHDFDRKIVGERSRNFIGGDEDKTAKLKTTNRVSHFIADTISFRKI